MKLYRITFGYQSPNDHRIVYHSANVIMRKARAGYHLVKWDFQEPFDSFKNNPTALDVAAPATDRDVLSAFLRYKLPFAESVSLDFARKITL